MVAVPTESPDPARATIPIAEIAPAIVPPIAPESLTPLSERSARQLTAAEKLILEQRFTEAALELERALRYDPNHPEIHRALATLHWHAGNGERAEVHAARTLSLNPADAAAHFVMGRRYVQRGNFAEAITSFRTALACPDLGSTPYVEPLVYYHLAQSLAVEGYLEAALEKYAAFDRAAAKSDQPNDSELASLMRIPGGAGSKPSAKILERLGRFNEAAAALAPVVSSENNENIEVTIEFAELLARAGRVPDALEAIRNVPTSPSNVLQLLAELHAKNGSQTQWITDLTERQRRSPNDTALILELCRALAQTGRTEEASSTLDAFLQAHPAAANIRMRRAGVQLENRDWNNALRTLAEGLPLDPNPDEYIETALTLLATAPVGATAIMTMPVAEISDGNDAFLRGALAARLGNVERAESYLKHALEAGDSTLRARELLAQIYVREYRYDDAMAVAARANSDVAESARLERALGNLHERLDDLDQAEIHFRAALQLDRRDSVSALGLADVYQRSRRTLQAQRQLRVLLKDSPTHEVARERLALIYWREGKVDEARVQLEKLEEIAETPGTRSRCRILLSDFPPDDYTKYRNRLLESFDTEGATATAWLEVADSYNGIAELEPMLEAYRAAISMDPDSERAHLGVVRTLARLLDYEKAIDHLAALLPRRPNRHAWRLELVDLYRAAQNFDAALDLAHQQASKSDLDEETKKEYRLRILDTLRLAKREGERLESLEKWAEGQDLTSEWPARLAAEYRRAGKLKEALSILQGRYEADTNDRTALAALADGLVAAGSTDRACQYVLNWIHEDPEGSHAIAQLIGVLGDGGRIIEALRLAKNHVLHTEYREFFQTAVIQLLQQAERYDQCVDWIDSLMDQVLAVAQKVEEGQMADAGRNQEDLSLRPDEPYAIQSLQSRLSALRAELAQTLILAKEYREAEERITDWLAVSRSRDDSYAYLNWLSIVRQALGEDERATEALEKALALAPRGVRINNDLAYSWIDRGIRLGEAEQMIRFAVSQAPDQAAYLDTLAWLFYKKGEFSRALTWLTRALRIMANDDPVLHDHLGDTYWRLGDGTNAVASWTRAMEIVKGMADDQFLGADSRRVRDHTQAKIDDANEGREPKVAELAVTKKEESATETDGPSDRTD